ncbi:MAG TPA: FAD-dependent oxidoreductase, partial [Synergistales bacterium]|nr:FAD-dependent oxidoreductase [Synergistales bacterium]
MERGLMATMITMPKLGLTMTEGSVLEWKKNEGDTLKKGEIVLVVATDKLTYEVEAPNDGLLLRIAVKAGETVPVGAILGAVGEKGEEIDLKIAPLEEAAPPREEPAPEKDKARPSGDLEVTEPAPAREGTARRVVIIGGGPGGYVAAIRAAQLGGRVTLVEK